MTAIIQAVPAILAAIAIIAILAIITSMVAMIAILLAMLAMPAKLLAIASNDCHYCQLSAMCATTAVNCHVQLVYCCSCHSLALLLFLL